MTAKYEGAAAGRGNVWVPLVVICLTVAMAASAAIAQPAARTEVLPVPSVTLTNQQILSGSLAGAPVTLAGELRLPASGGGRLPAVVLVHGSGGIGANIDTWARDLNAVGIAAFILDSFTGRGIADTVTDQSQLDELALMTDAYRALAVLSKHPRIDPKRIAVMGFSKGAVAAVYSANARFRRLYDPGGPGFAAHVGLYTPCHIRLRDDTKTTGAPIRMFHGTPDDWIPVAPCRAYVADLRKAGADVVLTEYPGAWHTYDNPTRFPPVMIPTAQSPRDCRIVEGADGKLLNEQTGAVFTFADACMQRGAHAGFDPAAYEATRKAVLGFLKDALKP